MATKAELEAELEELKRLLAEAQAAVRTDAADAPDDGDAAAEGGRLDWALGQIDRTELEALFRRFVSEAKDMHQRNPLLTTAFGALVVGYILGRTR
ncbi:hypothetical protein [Tropicimonas sp. IMCC34043]|uniref:hypothetical protein n=1 Tax=Tropicimonas sp. IMCC34043 TaxID=2248760 RepID=UPI000E230F79|nr:hypothetical protein [Tropicimonas sp. IMCC34043]